MARFSTLLAGASLLGAVFAFPPTPQNITVVKSKFGSNITISFKEVIGVCETTPGVKSYAGYVNLPPDSLEDVGVYQNYSINTFFYFFESRKSPETAPLSIWMNGGPGSSSMIGLFQENGPCIINDDSDTTTLNPWSWNNEVNMLYIDQPVQVGFSYDVPTNGTLDPVSSNVTITDFHGQDIMGNYTSRVGTFPSENQYASANGTYNAARSLWEFTQVWFDSFPQYQTKDNKISIFTESYGGRYGPAFTSFFEEQNMKIENGTLKETGAYDLHLDTLGIINGCIDLLSQEESYPTIAYNNTYGIQAINETVYKQALNDFTKPGGCRDKIVNCRTLAAAQDPNDFGAVDAVNAACIDADQYCSNQVEGPYITLGDRGYYDFAHPSLDPFPPEYYLGYLSKQDVQAALGVPINFTESINSVYYAFSSTGDYPRGGFLEDLAYILESGIKVALFYGDRDYACNWIGGEAASLAVNYSGTAQFAAAGYADMVTNSTYNGGLTRQYGNFSFTRVFESGHEIPAYQPETAYRIFTRALFGMDIATGNTSLTDNYTTTGPSDTFAIKNDVPPFPQPTCYVLSPATCPDDVYAAVQDGSALVKNYIVEGNGTSSMAPSGTASSSGGTPVTTKPVTSTSKAPGATSTGAAERLQGCGSVGGLVVAFVGLVLSL
ncbi:MAG: hypothetical protein M1824_000912 [Vezdaea acicularis]|nr:MAG: hypothetical protein M1824_000912 [Vezdaea acicularis]